MEFNEMKNCFKKCFAQYRDDDFSPPNDEKWVYAVVSPKMAKEDDALKGFHYELVARGSGAGEEYYVELHFELYKHQYSDLRTALISKFTERENRRKILATSYYSSLIWRVRTPVFDEHDIVEGVALLRKAVNEVLEDSAGTPALLDGESQGQAEEELVLPCPLSIGKIAEMLGEGTNATRNHAKNILTIPPIQRGKVWNAARIETLWDSLFRGFPVGALSVWHNKANPHAYELLDGQQRATAITLGFEKFPGHDSKFDSILWIDLEACRGDDGRPYRFFVTTASQPWGYAESSSETRNSLLSASEKRDAAKALDEWEENQIKPYPFQLSPAKAEYPVPYTLLRQFAEENDNRTFVDFRKWLEPRINKFNKRLHEILGKFTPTEEEDENFRQLCKKISALSKDYTVFLLDASSVTENDIALYFTRIGKGGVVPSDEELAYSVLKSKLPSSFRAVIQEVHREYGLASEPRIAHLAIRLFKSESKRKDSPTPQFYSGSAFSAVMDMCKRENASEKEAFARFIEDRFKKRVQTAEENYALTQWHCARYASERNGDAFLLLLLAAGNDGLFGNYNVKGLAELLFGYASHIDYAVRKILEQGVPIAIANLTKETYYGRPRLTLPIAPKELEGIPDDSIASLLKWKNDHPDVAQAIAEGYGNPSNNHACNILLYACRGSELNNQFKYDPNLDLWSEENLPWDYDHIMPHSTIEKMPDSDAKIVCEWLKNSIGNLAPLPFSVNRSLSDSFRDASYPSSKSPREARHLCVDGQAVAGMWCDGRIDPLKFALATIRRFSCIYSQWYDDLGMGSLFDFKSALEQSPTFIPAGGMSVIRRYSVMTAVQKEVKPIFAFKHIVADNKEKEIAETELHRSFCGEDWMTLSYDIIDGLAVALVKCQSGGNWEIGFRKGSNDETTKNEVQCEVQKLCERHRPDCLEHLCKDNTWWYWCEELPDQTECIERELASRLNKLLVFARMLLKQ